MYGDGNLKKGEVEKEVHVFDRKSGVSVLVGHMRGILLALDKIMWPKTNSIATGSMCCSILGVWWEASKRGGYV